MKKIPLYAEYGNMKTCPYPLPKNIEPCSCKVDDELKVFLICNMEYHIDAKLLIKLNKAFVCKKEVHLFEINLNGNRWFPNFSNELLGQFKISYFHLFNFHSIGSKRNIGGNIEGGTFNGSTYSLKELHIETSKDGQSNRVIETGAFSELRLLKKISIGNSFGTLQSKAFFDLPNLEFLTIDEQSISTIDSGAFENLSILKVMDLSNQLISSLSSRSFCNMFNLTELNLSSNKIKKIQNNTFYNLQSLVNLDLSRNSEFCHIGNMLSDMLDNPDLVVNLAGNNVNILLEDSFKPFIETVTNNNGRGYINMTNNSLNCNCDVKWLVNSDFGWTNIIQNTSCKNGKNLEEVTHIISYLD